MRRVLLLTLALVLLLCACDAGDAQDLRLFCENFSRFAIHEDGLVRIRPEQFYTEDEGRTYDTYLGANLLLSCGTAENRVHSLTLTGLIDAPGRDFSVASLCVIQAFAGIPVDRAERWLGTLGAPGEVMGIRSFEEDGWRVSYAANEAGRWFRISRLRYLPQEPEPPTLREPISNDMGE